MWTVVSALWPVLFDLGSEGEVELGTLLSGEKREKRERLEQDLEARDGDGQGVSAEGNPEAG